MTTASIDNPDSGLSPAWRRALPGLLLALLALLLLYRETALAMVTIWERSETFAHAFVVPPISLWLIWRQRALLATLTPRPAPLFLLPMVGLGLLWLLGWLATVNAATQFALVGMLVLAVPATLGWPVARAIAFPLGFLFFAVPFGEFLMPQLMEWTAHFTVAALRLSGIPVYQEGLQFIIPSGSWSVVEACSGIRYLMASVMVGALFAYLNYRSMKRRWIFVAISAILPLAANWLRAYLIVLLGHLSSNQLATGADHLVYGWVLFGIIMLALFMIGARWAEPDPPLPPRGAPEGPSGGGTATLPGSRGWLTSALLVLLCAAPLGLVQWLEGRDSRLPVRLQAPALEGSGWRAGAAMPPGFKPAFEFPAAELEARYGREGGPGAVPGAVPVPVGLYVGYYRQQDFRSKLISSNNVLVRSKDSRWAKVSDSLGGADLPGGARQALRMAELRGAAIGAEASGQRLRVWQLYWINGRWLTVDWQAKIYASLCRLLGQGDDGAVLVIYAEKGEAGQGDAALAAFVRDNLSSLDTWLRGVRDAGRAGAR
ncbi:MAG: exosortase A [Burkholderiaceae bacterium]